ncbi:MAG: choice-of-anchor L domain-containing protein [Bacteroidetes bacterium]|nr:choice-of-anchor L domain-containing protein [Bacteroidota bacterium]
MRIFFSLIFFSALLAVSSDSFSQLQVTPNNNPAQLAQTLAGNGVTISGATMNCPSLSSPTNNPSGTFVGTSSNIGIAGGVLLTSGDVQWAVGPNISPSSGADNNFTFNDPDLMAIDPNLTNDVCILEFDAKPTCNTLAFTFSFGSEEYPEFVGSFNDGFGIFVTGTNPSGPNYTGYNMALLPPPAPPGTPVSINNVNNGNYSCPGPPSGPCANCSFYIDNCTGTTVEYDAFTKPVTVTLSVVPCTNYHFKLAIADALDHIYDTGVFFAMQSLICATSLTVAATYTNSVCSANTGAATVTSVQGGQSPYTYVWNTTPPQNTQTATGLAPGSYTVNVVDANGCLSGTQSVTISTGGGFTVTPTQVNVKCFGANNGSASITNPTGGSAPYTYAWSTNPVQTSTSINNVPAGNYTCTITDATGCTFTQTFTITQPPALTASIVSSTNVSCPPPSNPNGSATASGSGGNGTLTYSWSTSPSQSGATANNLAAGNYIVTVTDANGCTKTASVTITSPATSTLTTSSTPADCGVTNGTATANITGGANPHTYLWLTNPIQSTPTATGLQGGSTYTIIVTDGNGCTQMQNITIGGGKPPVANFTYTPFDVVNLLDPLVIFSDASLGNTGMWNWNFGDSLSSNNISSLQNPTHTYSDTGIYCITLAIADPSGVCKDTLVKCLRVEAPFTFYIPNAFTPGRTDGINDFFTAFGTYIKEFEMEIFDRWGNLVWSCHTFGNPQSDSKCTWDGKIKRNGDTVQEDVYVWKVHLKDLKDKKYDYIGTITIAK